MTDQDLVVVWNGTRAQGPYLVTEYDVPRVAPPLLGRAAPCRERILDILEARPATMRELAACLGIDVGRVNGAIYEMKRQHEITVVGERWNERRQQPERVYALQESGR